MKIRLAVFAVACIALAVFVFGELWITLVLWLSPEGIQRYSLFHWGVLGLCILWLWLKRKAVFARMEQSVPSLPFMLSGTALLAAAILLPKTNSFWLFRVLTGWLGVFTFLFSEASVIPSVLLAVYGFSLAFPIAMEQWLGGPAALLATNTVAAVSRGLGLPVTSTGLELQIISRSGEVLSPVVVPGCAGFATISVFLSFFALMMLDVRLPLRRAWYVFLIGLAGTWLQNIVRIVIIVAAGYFWGMDGLNATHYNSSYVVFPLWFLLFAYLYIEQARRGKRQSELINQLTK